MKGAARPATRLRRAAGHAPPDGRHHPRELDDAGFTLIELIITVAIMPIVVGGIAVALISVFYAARKRFRKRSAIPTMN